MSDIVPAHLIRSSATPGVHHVPLWLAEPLVAVMALAVIALGALMAAVFVVNVRRFPTGKLFLPTRATDGIARIDRAVQPVGYWFGMATAFAILLIGLRLVWLGVALLAGVARWLTA